MIKSCLSQPSSSARSAALLTSSGGTSGFIGFGGFQPSPDVTTAVDPGFVPLAGLDDPDIHPDVPGEMRVALRKMGKKDAVTRLKVGPRVTCVLF